MTLELSEMSLTKVADNGCVYVSVPIIATKIRLEHRKKIVLKTEGKGNKKIFINLKIIFYEQIRKNYQ